MASALEPTDGRSDVSSGIVVTRLFALLALIASSALYVQYLDPANASFCGLHSGCEAVRRSGLGYLGSRFVSLPLAGLVGYGVVFFVCLFRPRGKAVRYLTLTGAVLAVGLVLIQALYVKAFCWLCLVVDVAAILAAVGGVMDTAAKSGSSLDPLNRGGWIGFAAFAVLLPMVWVGVKPSAPVPDVIRALYEPGKVNVVEFADFECPFCRALHPILRTVLKSYPPGQVRFLRKHVPLPLHEQAKPAARADICAEAQGKGDALADRLVAIELSPDAIRSAARSTGVDMKTYDACLASSDPDRRIASDTETLQQAGMEGLPTTYVAGKRLLGLVSEESVRDAIDRAVRGESESGVPGPIFLALSAAVAAGIAWLGRRRRATLQHGAVL